jgi:HAD superfamily hydrolase (TIGR01490 family)
MRLVLVDLDGTLLDHPSIERRFIRYLARQGMLGPRQWLAAGVFFLRWTLRFGRAVGRKNKAYLSGLEQGRVARAAEAFVTGEILHRLQPTMLGRLRRHAAAGDALVLLTGAPDFIATPLARRLGAECCATVCRARNGCFTASPPLRHPLGAEKLALARELAHSAGVELIRCIAYADSGDDIPLLEAVGRAVAVNPDRRLAHVAACRDWEVVQLAPRAGWTKRMLGMGS